MIAALQQTPRVLSFGHVEQIVLTGGVAGRLLLAAALGGAIGIDREWRHKASGIRTNLLICFGAAFFTFLSSIVAGEGSPNRAQIASNIVQGIGFLGAGLILHNRDRVSGLTSAATVWAVASIGMACGAGLYVPAIFSTLLVLLVLEFVGVLEWESSLKFYALIYELRGSDAAAMTRSALAAMDREKRRLDGIRSDVIGDIQRMSFQVSASRKVHKRLGAALNSAPEINEVFVFRDPEEE